MKVDAPAAPAEPISEPADDAGFGDFGGGEEPAPENDDKPFDDEPFDAGVEADEETDPKKFIEQLTGKLGQSLRKYTEEQGQPDFELEKFAINSLISATHTAEMDEEDKKDIIKKINTSGDENDNEISGLSGTDDNNDSGDDSNDSVGDDSFDMGDNEEDLQELSIYENKESNIFLENPPKNNMFQDGSNDILDEDGGCWSGYERVPNTEKFAKDSCRKIKESAGSTEGGYEDEYGSVENINLNEAEYKGKTVKLGKPMKGDVKKFKVYVKNDKGNVIKVNFGDPNMEIKRDDPERKKSFRARHKCSEAKDRTTPKYWSCKMWSSTPVSKMVAENLNNSEKSSTFDKNYLSMKLHETFGYDDSEPMVQPAPVQEPTTKPNETQPTTPSRKNKPFLPMPEVTPDPKAVTEAKFDYSIYHKTLASCFEEARKYVLKRGYDSIDFDLSDEQHVNYGHTQDYNKELTINGKPQRTMLHIQVYRMDSGNYELNMYFN